MEREVFRVNMYNRAQTTKGKKSLGNLGLSSDASENQVGSNWSRCLVGGGERGYALSNPRPTKSRGESKVQSRLERREKTMSGEFQPPKARGSDVSSFSFDDS